MRSERLLLALAHVALSAAACASLDGLVGSADAGNVVSRGDATAEDAAMLDDAGKPAIDDAPAGDANDAGTADAQPDGSSTCSGGNGLLESGRVVACPAPGGVHIDGDLSEWTGSIPWVDLTFATARPPSPFGWPDDAGTSPANDATLSGRFALLWDASNIYVIVKITDDIRGVHPPSLNYWYDDAVELFFSGQNEKNAGYGPSDHQFIMTADYSSSGHRGGEFIVGNGPSPLTFADQVATSEDPSGPWTLEARIPISAIGAPTLVPGVVMGFDIIFDDSDEPGPTDASSPQRWLMFTRQANDDPSWTSASFGEVVLRP